MSNEDKKNRSQLPIQGLQPARLITFDAKDPDTKFPPIDQLRPPKGAPNVLILLIDDVGFGASSAFGGPCQTPNAERLAAGGLKYNRFHTTALCSPTRKALLTGRNHSDDGCDVGEDTGASVSPDYGPHGNAFNGTVKGVEIAIANAAENSDHLVSPEEALRVAMARQ